MQVRITFSSAYVVGGIRWMLSVEWLRGACHALQFDWYKLRLYLQIFKMYLEITDIFFTMQFRNQYALPKTIVFEQIN